MEFKCVPNQSLRHEYQRLLTLEWGDHTIIGTLHLLNSLLKPRVMFPWEIRTTTLNKESQRFNVPNHYSAHLKTYLERFYFPEPTPALETLPQRKSDVLVDLSHTAQKASFYISLQYAIRAEGDSFLDDSGMFRDVQSLLFINLVESFLPILRHHRMEDEHAFLFNALRVHAIVVWQDQPAHASHLSSLLTDYIGLKDKTIECLEYSFNATPTTNHEYLTKAQALLFEYLDQRQFDRAKKFVLDIYRVATEAALSEIREMLQMVIEIEHKALTSHRGGKRAS